MSVQTAADPQLKHQLAKKLAVLLGDTYTLYTGTQGAHWNVEGPNFHGLHALFMEQYEEMALAIDGIAERVRALGFYAPGTMQGLRELATLDEVGHTGDSKPILEYLIGCHETVVKHVVEVRKLAEECGDEVTVDLMNERQNVHEEALWMLRSSLGKGSQTL